MADDIIKNLSIGSPDWRNPDSPLDIVPGYSPPQQASMPEEVDWSPRQIVNVLRKGVGMAYEIARGPLTASEDLTRQFQEMRMQPNYKRAPTAQGTGPSIIRQATEEERIKSPVEKFARFGENVLAMGGDLAPVALGAGMVRDDIVRQMKPAVKATSKMLRRTFRSRLPAQQSARYAEMLKRKGFTADSHKTLMKFVKKFHKEAPDDFVDFLGFIKVHGTEQGATSVKPGIRAFYQPGTRGVNLPAVVPGKTGGHEIKHALWDWIGDKMAKDPSFAQKHRKVQSFMSRAEWNAPMLRREWWQMADEMQIMQKKGLINTKEHLAAYQKFDKFYRKGIPEEYMANTFADQWLNKGASMQDALADSMKASSRILDKQKHYREALRKEFQTWKQSIKSVSKAETEVGAFNMQLKSKMVDLSAEDAIRQLQKWSPKQRASHEKWVRSFD